MPRLSADVLLQQLRRKVSSDVEWVSDRELLHRFAVRRDESAFDVLLSRYAPLVWGLCLRQLRHRQDAEDAFQATFLTLARSAASVRKPDSLGCWLYGIATRIAAAIRLRDHRRQERERRSTQRETTDALDELTGRELCAVLDQELGKLPPRYRDPLVLCHLQGWTRDEAARRLGLSLGTLKRRLEQGRELLRERISRRGLALSAGLLGGLLAHAALCEAAPPALTGATVGAAVRFAQGELGRASASSAALARGTLRALRLARLKAWAATGLVLVLVAVVVLIGCLRAGPEAPASTSSPPVTHPAPVPETPEPFVPSPPEAGPPPVLARTVPGNGFGWVNAEEVPFLPGRLENAWSPSSIQDERIQRCRPYHAARNPSRGAPR